MPAEAQLLARIVAFIRLLGIDVHERAMTRDTFVPGIDIQDGAVVVEAGNPDHGHCE